MRYRATRQGDVVIDGVRRALFAGQVYDLPEMTVDWLEPETPAIEPANTTDDLESLTVRELRARLEERGEDTSGRKAELIARLRGDGSDGIPGP